MTYLKVKMTTDPSEMSLKKVLFNPTNEIRILNHEQADNTLLTTLMIIHDFEDTHTRDSILPQIVNEEKAEFDRTIESILEEVSDAFVANYHKILEENAKLGNPLAPNYKNVVSVETCIPGLEKLFVDRERWELFTRLYRLDRKMSQKYPLEKMLKGNFLNISISDETYYEYVSAMIIVFEVFLCVITINSVYGGLIFSALNLMSGGHNYIPILGLLLHAIVQAVKIYLDKSAANQIEEKTTSYVDKVTNNDVKNVMIDDTMFIFVDKPKEPIFQNFDISLKVHTHKSSAFQPFKTGFNALLTKIIRIHKIKGEILKVGYIDGISRDELIGASGKKLSYSERHAIGIKYDQETKTLFISHPILRDAFDRLNKLSLLHDNLLLKDDFANIPPDFFTVDFNEPDSVSDYVAPFLNNADLKFSTQMSYNWRSINTEKRPYCFLKEGTSMNFYDPIFECFFPNHFIKIVKKDAITIDPTKVVTEDDMIHFGRLVERHEDLTYNKTTAYSILKFLNENCHSCGCSEYFANFVSDYLTSIDVLNHMKDSKLSKVEYHLKQEYENLFKKTKRQELSKTPIAEHSDFLSQCAYNESFFDIDFCFLEDGDCHSLVIRFAKRKPYFRFKDEKLEKLNVLSLYDLVVNCNHGELSSSSRVGWNLVDIDNMGSDDNLNRTIRRTNSKPRHFTYDLMMITFTGSVTQYLIPEWLGESLTVYEEKHEGARLFEKSSLFSALSCIPATFLANHILIECLEKSSNKLISFMDGVISAMSTSIEFSTFKNTMLNNLKRCTQASEMNVAKQSPIAGTSRNKSFRSYLRSSRPNHVYDALSYCISKKQNGLFTSEEMCMSYNLRSFGKVGVDYSNGELSYDISSREELYNNHPCALRLRNLGHFVFGKHFRCKVCRNNYGTSFELSLCQLGHQETAIEAVRSNTITSQIRAKLQPTTAR
nr:P5-1 [Southern rice black-streaked dwarf virus]